MIKTIKPYIIIFITSFLLTSCASILNPKFQKVTIKTDKNSTVLIDGRVPERTKDGRYLIRRDAESKQITVKKEGYTNLNTSIIQYKKSPYFIMSLVPFGITIFPIFCDNMIKSRNYVKEVSLNNKMIELPNKEKVSSIIEFNNIITQSNNESNFSRISIPYRKFINGNQSARKKDKKIINLSSDNFSKHLIELFEEQKYMKYEKNNIDKLYINATLNNYRYHSFWSEATANGGTISNYGNMLYVEMGIKWEIMDYDKNILFTYQTNNPSGQFAYGGGITKTEARTKSIKDGIHYNFIELLNSIDFKKELEKKNVDLKINLSDSTKKTDTINEQNYIDIISVENKDGILYLSKKNMYERASFRGDGTIGVINKSVVVKMVEDVPELHKFANKNINSGKGFTSALISCYNDYKLTGKTKTLNQSYFYQFGLITKKEYRNGPSEEILKVKQPIYGEIKERIVTTTHYSNSIPSSTTVGSNFRFKFSYGNAEYKKGFLLNNLKIAIGDDKEALKHIRKYRANWAARLGLKVAGVAMLVFTLKVADDQNPLGISSDATPFLAIPTIGLFTWAFMPQKYKSKNISNAINTYNGNLK